MIKKILLIAFVLFNIRGSVSQTSDNTPPTLLNFRIESSAPNRVYFNSSEPITASSTSGFTISGKTISGIAINNNNTEGHYFTVSSAFTFWDNNTIRYSSGSDMRDSNINSLYSFDLQYIVNNIAEPTASINRYASLSGSGSHDGTSEGNAWTLGEAATNAIAGQKVWVKAGGNFKAVSFKNNGKVDKPIIVKGYVSTIGDLDGVSFHTYSIGDVVNNASAPTLKGSFGTTNDNGLTITGDYIIIENFQSHGWKRNFYSLNNASAVIKNCLSHKTSVGLNPSPDGYGFYIRSNKTRIINSLSINSDMGGFWSTGNNNMIKDCTAYTDSNAPGGDYFFSIRGNNNILKGCLAKKTEKDANGQHGLSVKGESVQTEYNLVEDCITWNSSFPIEARHDEVKYNVFRNISVNRDPQINTRGHGGAIMMMNGPSYNIFDNITVTDGEAGIRFLSSGEDSGATQAGEFNTFKNCNFNGNIYGITISEDSDGQNRVTSNNLIINCNFYNNDYLFGVFTTDVRNNEIINSNVINTVKGDFSGSITSGFNYSHSNFYNNTKFNTPSTNGNLSLDPNFFDASRGDFRLKSNSQIIDKGIETYNVNTDNVGNPRPQGNGIDIGAFEFHVSTTTSSTDANAGADVSICRGDNTTLTASGGTSYSWNTGETTQSISVNPTTTTTYSVTVSNGSDSDTDSVIVTVVDLPTINAGADVTIEAGSSTTLTANGDGSFLWSTGETTQSISVSPLSTITYTVSVTSNNGCSNEDTVIVTVQGAAPNDDNNNNGDTPVTANAGEDVEMCINSTGVILTASGGVTYLWNTGETTASISVNPLVTTTYTVTVSNSSSIDSDTVTVLVNEDCSEIGGRNSNNREMNLYPNPTNGLLNIELSGFSDLLNITMYSLNGNLIYSENIDDYSPDKVLKRQIDVSRFGKGVYFVRLINNNNSETKKVLVI